MLSPHRSRLGRVLIAATALVLLGMPSALSATYYVAVEGSDTNTGAIASPFATIQRAQTAAAAGDTIYIRGGTYTMSEAQIATPSAAGGLYAYVTDLTKSGSAGKRINYWAYPGERPIFDYSNVKPADQRVVAFHVSGSWLHIRGLEITGVQVTITTHTQSECFENDGGSNNIYEQCSMHDGMAIGFYLTRGSNNLILNCDAYRNWDSVSEGGVGGNVDGFGGHPNRTTYTGNVFRGCRAWFNSDDGYDCINASATITLDNCWAFFNGYTSAFVSRGDGNGFKAGGYGAAGGAVPSPIPRHRVQFCLAVRNKVNGFYSNHHVGGSDWFNNTAFQNGTNYNLLSTLADNDTDVPGYGHVLKNNLGFSPRSTSVSNLDQTTPGANDLTSNFFTLPVTVTTADFTATTTDTTQLTQLLTQPRKPNGDLPDITLLHLVSGSDLIDAGTAIGFPFTGTAPDLGAFEFGTTTTRTLKWKGDGAANAWDLNTTANWLFGSTVATFFPGVNVVFDDAGSATSPITLTGTLWPNAVTISGAQNYTFTGAGTLAGPMVLTTAGVGTLTLTGQQTFTGATTISAGTLKITGSLTNNAIVDVLSGATLDATGAALTTGSVRVHPGGTLIGGGAITGTLQNEGTVLADGGATQWTLNGSVANTGTFRLTRGAKLATTGAFTNSGTLDLITAGSAAPANLVNTGTVLIPASVGLPKLTVTGATSQLALPSHVGHRYQIQRSKSLDSASWLNVGTPLDGTGSTLLFTDSPAPTDPRTFYRVVVAP